MSGECSECGWTHVAGDVVALSRWAGITGYRTGDGVIHQTRNDGQAWLCAQRQVAAATQPNPLPPP